MIRVSIVEDSREDRETLLSLINRWKAECEDDIVCDIYSDAVEFLEKGAKSSDIIFMDIRMPHMNGMDAAERLRRENSYSVLIFLTTLAGYAIRGYSVDAMDFILKPITEERFKKVFERARSQIDRKKTHITVNAKGTALRVAADEVKYIEASAHDKVFHIGKDAFTVYDDMEKLLGELPSEFFRCHRSYIINLNCVERIEKDSVKLVGENAQIPVSRNRHDALMNALTEYYAKNM